MTEQSIIIWICTGLILGSISVLTYAVNQGCKQINKVYKLLDDMQSEIADVGEVAQDFAGCISADNHRKETCIKTGHWND